MNHLALRRGCLLALTVLGVGAARADARPEVGPDPCPTTYCLDVRIPDLSGLLAYAGLDDTTAIAALMSDETVVGGEYASLAVPLEDEAALPLDTPTSLRAALGLVATSAALLEDASYGLPEDSTVAPIDTLRMSAWERIYWGRHGLFRLTRLYPLHPDNPVDDLRQLSKTRRAMLTWHQRLGLATVASMAVTVVGGQLALNGKGSELHEASLPFTIGLYSTTAALALLSPPKLVHRPGGGWDTITFHKAFAVVHLAGMILTPLLAPSDGRWDRRHIHQISGYATFAAFSAGMITVTFFR